MLFGGGGEFVDAGGVVGDAGGNYCRGIGGDVGGVGVVLGLHDYGSAVGVGDGVFAEDFAVEEVAYVELEAGFVGVDFHGDACGGGDDAGGYEGGVAGGVEDEVVVVAEAVAQLLVVGVDVTAYGFGGAEIEGGAFDGAYLAAGHERAVDGREGVGVDVDFVAENVAGEVAGEVEVGVVGEIEHGGTVGCGRVVDGEGCVGAEGVGDAHVDVAGVAGVAVG